MSDKESSAPEKNRRSQSVREVVAAPGWARPLAALLLIALLTACGTNSGPNAGIQPAETGNFVVQVSPTDAEVTIAGEGTQLNGALGARSRKAVIDGRAELYYELEPGSYQVRVTRDGYEAFERSVEIGESESETDEKVFLEVELKSSPPAGSDDDGAGDGGGGEDGADGDGGGSDHGGEAVTHDFSLRGDPHFSPSGLSTEQRVWYDRVWAAVNSPDGYPDVDGQAASNEVYYYARALHTHLQALLMALRATGDLRFLDEVDRITQIMRNELSDTNGDGHLNWIYQGTGGESDDVGKDTHKSNEIKTHTIIAAVAYALDLNRDLSSPAGRDYGEHADFWETYLTEHFEPKWRERSGASQYPYLSRPHTHTWVSNVKYHLYMHRLTGDEAYLEAAHRLADVLWDHEIKDASTDSGPAYVWARSVISEGGSGNYLHPTTYARYVYGDIVEFHLEGFSRWKDEEELKRFARTFTEYVLDESGSGDDWFASDIGGGRDRAGIDSDSGWDRLSISKYAISLYAMISPWDASGEVAEVSFEVLDENGDVNNPNSVFLPASLLFDASVRGL